MSKSRSKSLPVFYVYALLDPRKPGYYRYGRWVFHFEPFYLGKGKGRRWKAHKFNDGFNKHKTRKIAKIFREGYEIEVRILKEELTEREALDLEVDMIAKIGRTKHNGPLTNATDGGEGMSGYKRDKAARERTAATWAARKGTKAERIRRQRISDSTKGVARGSLSPDMEAKRLKEFKKSIVARTADERATLSKTLARNAKKLHKSRTPEQLEAIRLAKQRAWANRTPEQNRASAAKRLAKMGKQPRSTR